MADEITDRLHKFVLTEEEKDSVEIDVQDIMSSMEHCEVSLLGKVIADKQVSVLGVKNTMTLVWGNPIGLKVLLVGKNLFQFVFRHKEDMKKVLYGTPWLYDKYLLNIHQWQPELHANSHIFNISELWLQVWNIPLHWISYEVGSKIGHALGGTSDVAIPENGSKEGRHMRIKVLMSINRPLPRGKLIKMGSEEKWVEFRYENLPYVCYYCGILGHTERSCVLREEDVRKGNVKRDQFGVWMRAENHGLTVVTSRRQGNHNVRAPIITKSKGKQIVDCVEGTGSNELVQNDDGSEAKRDTGNNEKIPFFAPHEFFKKSKRGNLVLGETSVRKNSSETIHGTNCTVRNNLKYGNTNEHAGQLEEGQGDIHTMLNQNDNDMQIDNPTKGNRSMSEKTQQPGAMDEPIFADTIGGREAREYYWLAKMNLPDTFDYDDIERYFNKQKEAECRQLNTITDAQLNIANAVKLESKNQQVSSSKKLYKASSSLIGIKEVTTDQSAENAIAKKSSTTAKIDENRRNLKRMARAKIIDADNEIMDTIGTNNNLVDVVITDHLESQTLGDKGKGKDRSI